MKLANAAELTQDAYDRLSLKYKALVAAATEAKEELNRLGGDYDVLRKLRLALGEESEGGMMKPIPSGTNISWTVRTIKGSNGVYVFNENNEHIATFNDRCHANLFASSGDLLRVTKIAYSLLCAGIDPDDKSMDSQLKQIDAAISKAERQRP